MPLSAETIKYWLNKLGNPHPTQKHKKMMGALLRNTSVLKEVSYSNKLSPQEVTCLILISKGYTAKEIAEFLSLSVKTIFKHRGSIFEKLQCRNMAQAVFEGVKYGYIDHSTTNSEYIHG